MSVELLITSIVCLAAGFIMARVLNWKESERSRLQPVSSNPVSQRSFLILPKMHEVSDFIETADKRSQNDGIEISVVRTCAGKLELLTSFQRRTRADEIAEVIYSTDEGFHFTPAKAA